MSESHASIYILSRGAAAAINAGAVAVFTRIASPDVYGQYLIGFAVCFVVYSLTTQWATYAHFGNFSRERAAAMASGLLAVTGIATLAGLAVLAMLAAFGILRAETAGPTAILLICFALYFVAVEIGRTNLLAATVTATTLTRSVFSLLLGALALWRFGSAAALLVGVGLGYGIGALPVFFRLRSSIWIDGPAWPTRAVIGRILRYGWPLILAFGASAAAMNIDRIILERVSDAATVAPYGAILDFMKQTFAVVGEATTFGYMSYARTLYSDGDRPAARTVLRRAFVAQCYIVVFGMVFYLLLGQPLFQVLLAPGYMAEALGLLPVLVVANAMLVLRSYLFGQVIYFSVSSKLESISSIVMLIVATLASLLLIPRFGAIGAAIAFALAQAAALLVYVLATPRDLRLPVDPPRVAAIIATGIGIVIVGRLASAALSPVAADLVSFVLIAAGSLYFLIRWNLFDAAAIAGRLRARLIRPGMP